MPDSRVPLTDSEPRHLVVVRHGKAEGAAASDAERSLTVQGQRDAAAAGAWLLAQGYLPDHALVSAALRTRETWAALAAGGSWELEPAVEELLYTAGPDAVLDLARGADDAVATLVVVGHNPTMGYLAQLLGDGDGDAEVESALLSGGFPTTAVAVLALDGSWSDLEPGTLRLEAFHVARG